MFFNFRPCLAPQANPKAYRRSVFLIPLDRADDRSLSKPDASSAEVRTPTDLAEDFPMDILVIASRLKAYIQARSGMNTSDAVLPILSDRLRTLCDAAIRSAHEAERKTVLERDFSG